MARDDHRQEGNRLLQDCFISPLEYRTISNEASSVLFPLHLQGTQETWEAGIDCEAFRSIAKMQDDGRLMSYRAGLQPLQPTRQISRRKHLGKDDVISSDVRLANARFQIGPKSSSREKLQKMKSKSGPGEQSRWAIAQIFPEDSLHAEATRNFDPTFAGAQDAHSHACPRRSIRNVASMTQVMSAFVNEEMIGKPECSHF
jgi:hypothetical protein